MNKVYLMLDNCYKLNKHIVVGKDNGVIKLILNNIMINNSYKIVYEIIDNHLVAIDMEHNAYIINNKGKIVSKWIHSRLNNIDEYYIGKYLDNLKLNTQLYTSKQIADGFYISIENLISKIIVRLYFEETKIKGTYKLILWNEYTNYKIESLIVGNKIEIPFIETFNKFDVVNNILIINKDLIYKEQYSLTDGNKYCTINMGIYTKNRLLTKAFRYKVLTNKLIMVYIDNSFNTVVLIYNNELKDTRYKFIGIENGILYTQDKDTNENIYYNINTLNRIDNINDLTPIETSDYVYTRDFQYWLNGKYYYTRIINKV